MRTAGIGLITVLATAVGAARAAPILIIDHDPNPLISKEVIGDPGGTNFSNPNGGAAGKGLPTLDGGWANTASFAPDPSYLDGTHKGISGWHSIGTNLRLSDPAGASMAIVTFTFVGKGDSTLLNEFWVDGGTGYKRIFGQPNGFDSADYSSGRSVSFLFATNGATGVLLPFEFVTGTPVTIANGSNLNHDTSPAFFLGVDPYSTATKFATQGTAVYAGLTDLPGTSDHDFQDLGVLITVTPVPEPSVPITLALSALGIGWVWRGRRRLQSTR